MVLLLPRADQMDGLPDIVSAGVTRSNINFVNPQAEVNGGIWTLFIGATAFLGLRLWCKMDRRTGLWWDDHILIAAWVTLLATNIFISAEFATGYVRKTWGDRMLILVTISSCLITVGQTLSKTAFAVTLLRITERWQRWVLWFIIGSLNLYLVIVLFINWTNYCDEEPYYWRMSGSCVPYNTVFGIKIGQNIYNIILDFVLSLFPWVITWNLNIEKYDKMGLCVTMSLGVLIAVFTSVRTWYMLDSDVNVYDEWYFWRQGMTEVWYQAEVAGTIMVQALPVIRLFLQDLTDVNLNETPGALTVGTGTNKTARNSRAWAAANNPHSLSDVSDLESGRAASGMASYQNSPAEVSIDRFEMRDLPKASSEWPREHVPKTSAEWPREQKEYVVQMGRAV